MKQASLSSSIDQGGGRARSSASCFLQRSAELFDKRASRLQIGKAPTIVGFAFSSRNCTASVSRLNVPRLVKIYDPTAQTDIQPVARNGKLNDVGVFALVCASLPARNLTHDALRPMHIRRTISLLHRAAGSGGSMDF